MSSTWSTALPQYLLVESYTEQAANKAIRTEMDAGPAKVRRRFTAGVRPVTGSIFCSATQLGLLKTYYNDTLYSGSLRFVWTDPVTSSAVEMRFTEPPTWSAVEPGYYKVNMKLEILP